MYKALLVDDEPYMIEGLKTLGDWGKYGFAICGEATNGDDALKLCRNFNPDLVCTDVRMPVMDGLQLIKQVRESGGSKVKFVILSGYDDFSYVRYAMRFGVCEYLLKPVDEIELNGVIAKISRQIQEEQRTQARREHRRALVANRTIQRFLKGDTNQFVVTKVKSLLKIADDEIYSFILLKINYAGNRLEQSGESELTAPKVPVKALIAASLAQQFGFRLFETATHLLGLIVPQALKQSIAALKSQLERNYNVQVTLAVSEKLPGLKSLAQLYRQATTALYYEFFEGEGSIIYYHEIKNATLNYNLANIRIDRLLEEIKHSNFAAVATEIDRLFQNFSRERLAPEVIKVLIKNLELEIFKLVLALNGPAGELSARFIKFNKEFASGDLARLQTGFGAFCNYLAEQFSVSGQSNSKDLIQLIKLYIKENYHQEINLKSLGREFHLNPVYLGQLFKKYTGFHYSEYLHQIRIDEAKRLLRQTSLKIAAIARAVGYQDPNYFVRNFKNITAVSPSEYKRQ
jgi:two-component system response regulator YesN